MVTPGPDAPSLRARLRRLDEESQPRWANWRSWHHVRLTSNEVSRVLLTLYFSNCFAVARRRTLFDDRPVEINELTFIIKQDLSSLNQQIGNLQVLTRQQHPKADQEGEHNKNVVFMLQGKLTDVSANFKDVLEERTKNIQASRSRTDNVRLPS